MQPRPNSFVVHLPGDDRAQLAEVSHLGHQEGDIIRAVTDIRQDVPLSDRPKVQSLTAAWDGSKNHSQATASSCVSSYLATLRRNQPHVFAYRGLHSPRTMLERRRNDSELYAIAGKGHCTAVGYKEHGIASVTTHNRPLYRPDILDIPRMMVFGEAGVYTCTGRRVHIA
jgi:hypothetical protein